MSQTNSRSNGSSRARDPPPTLFLHPSPAASKVSLVAGHGSSAAPPSPTLGSSTAHHQPTIPAGLARKGSLLNPHGRGGPPASVQRLQTGDSSRTVDRTDALWSEMQATLAEVELSASGGTHVFGPDHDRKLADLRAAQIALAQAWARSEADDAIETIGAGGMDEVRDLKGALGAAGLTSAAAFGTASAPGKSTIADGTEAAKSTVGSGSANLSNPQGPDGLGVETELDILMARRRREANDEYFSRVDRGVRDVVAKLDEVAAAMMAVEQETRDIWGDETSLENVKHEPLQ